MKQIDIQRLSLKAGLNGMSDDLISKRRSTIQKLNQSRKKKLHEIKHQLQQRQLSPGINQNQIIVIGRSIEINQNKIKEMIKDNNQLIIYSQQQDKNKGVGEMTKVAFENKYKNYLNHKQEFKQQAKIRQQAILQKRKKIKQGENQIHDYFNQDQILSNTGSQYQFKNAQDMNSAYLSMIVSKKQKKGKVQLFYAQKFQYIFRSLEFQALLNLMQKPQKPLKASKPLISKQLLLNYLFDQPMIMIVYSINPYLVADEITQFEALTPGMLTFEQFSSFLLTDRQPTYFQYTPQNLAEARKIGRGLKCSPIVGKWIDTSGIYEFIMEIFESIDMFGRGQVERHVLAKKLQLECQKKRIMDIEVIEIININKLITIRRLIYQLQHQIDGKQTISRQQLQNYLVHYHRLKTPDKQKLITKLIMAGKYDSSYIYVIGDEVLKFLKDVFQPMEKFAQFFVRKEAYIAKIVKNKKYPLFQNCLVRSQGNKYIGKQTLEQTLQRLSREGDTFIDIEEIMDFVSNRGRPKQLQYQIYLLNLQKQMRNISQYQQTKHQKQDSQQTVSSDEQFQNNLKKKRLNRKLLKLHTIHNNYKYKYNQKFNITVPIAFDFDQRDKNKNMSIRERKLKQMLQEKLLLQQQSMKPIPRKQVPLSSKLPLYDKMMKDYQQQRKQRLQQFRTQIQNSIMPISQRLLKKSSNTVHCDFSKQPYQFVARPMPWYCQVNLLERINQQKKQRRERILQQIIKRHHDADLPEGVLRMLQRHQKLLQKRQQTRSQSATSISQCTFAPKISHTIPDFSQIHLHLKNDLNNTKQNKKIANPIPFSFQNRDKKSKSSHLHCIPNQLYPIHFNRCLPSCRKLQEQIDIKPTLKYMGLVEKRKQQMEQKQRQQQQEYQQNYIRKMRKQKFAPQVRKILQKNKIQLQKNKKQLQKKIKEYKQQDRKKCLQYQNQMINIYTKVWNRPLLIQKNEYGENQIKNNPRLRDSDQKNQNKQIIKKQKEQLDKKHKKIDIGYQQRRKKAIEQPPGQYLIQHDQDVIELQRNKHKLEGPEFDGDDDDNHFQEEFLQHNAIRTS